MVPKRLKEARKAVGLSQEKLSELIGIEGVSTRSRLSSYEIGRTEPPFSLVEKIADVLGYPEYYFYTVNDVTAKYCWKCTRMENSQQTEALLTRREKWRNNLMTHENWSPSLQNA